MRAVLGLVLLPALVQGWTTISQSTVTDLTVAKIQAQFQCNGAPNCVPSTDPNMPSAAAERLGFIWTEPADLMDTMSGLTGTISWAWDWEMCDQLLPQFGERNVFAFIGCQSLHAAVHRGFSTWSDNNAHINFLDVTEDCEHLGYGGEVNSAAGRPGNDCPIAQVWVTWLDPALGHAHTNNLGSSRRRLVADTTNASSPDMIESKEAVGAGGTVVALCESNGIGTTNFRSTNGNVLADQMYQTYRSTVSFNTGQCWYLDSTFCSGFHVFKEEVGDPESAGIIVRFIIFGIWGISMCFFTYFLWKLVEKVKDRPEDTSWFTVTLNTLPRQGKHHGVLLYTNLLILIIAPLIFYTQIFQPCFECFDFEAAATHEIGHLLGLSHPDSAPAGANVYNSFISMGLPHEQRWNESTCLHPWESVTPGPNNDGIPPGAEVNNDGFRTSIMLALTQHNPKVCIENDDLEAIATLYPDCHRMVMEPVCFRIPHFLGWVRLFVWIAFPVLIILTFFMAINACVSHNSVQRLKSARRKERIAKETARANARAYQQAEMQRKSVESELNRAQSVIQAEENKKASKFAKMLKKKKEDSAAAAGADVEEPAQAAPATPQANVNVKSATRAAKAGGFFKKKAKAAADRNTDPTAASAASDAADQL